MTTSTTQDFQAAVGRIIIRFSRLELYVDTWLWLMIGTDQSIGQIVTAELPFGAKTNLLRAFYNHYTGRVSLTREEFDSIAKDIQDCQTKRNDLVHSLWVGPPNGGFVRTLRSSAKARYTFKSTERTIDDLNRIGNDIESTADKLQAIVSEWSKYTYATASA